MAALSKQTVKPMSESEARECVAQISSGIESMRAHILDLHERSGWMALGYKSWRECVGAEFPQAERQLYRELTAAKIELVLSHGSKTPVHLAERHARELAKLDPKDQPKAWAEAVKTAPDGVVTAKHVAAVVTARLPAPPPKRVQPSPEAEQHAADVANDCAEALDVEDAAPPKPAKWECEGCGQRWPSTVTVCAECAECDTPSGTVAIAEVVGGDMVGFDPLDALDGVLVAITDALLAWPREESLAPFIELLEIQILDAQQREQKRKKRVS